MPKGCLFLLLLSHHWTGVKWHFTGLWTNLFCCGHHNDILFFCFVVFFLFMFSVIKQFTYKTLCLLFSVQIIYLFFVFAAPENIIWYCWWIVGAEILKVKQKVLLKTNVRKEPGSGNYSHFMAFERTARSWDLANSAEWEQALGEQREKVFAKI